LRRDFFDRYANFYLGTVFSRVLSGYRPRVLALVISPYARPGFCCHTTFDFTSPLKLIEERFNLKPLTSRDDEANDMLDCFDFRQKPVPPDVITPQTKLDVSHLKTTMP